LTRQNAVCRAGARTETFADRNATVLGNGNAEDDSDLSGSEAGLEAESEAESATDDELVEAILDSDHESFNLLYNRYFQRIYNFSYARLRNHADTEEVVQETFISVFKSIEAYRGESLLVSWIYGIARNTVNNHLRRTKTQRQRLEAARLDLVRLPATLASCSPEENLGLQRCAETIQEQLNSVGEWHAQVFIMRHLQNMTIAEIANKMSRSSDSVRSSLYRVKRLLVESVDPRFAGTSASPRHVSEGVA
jgi:RNA polymerase sigma-70 factor (ECF subfamily)